MFKWSSIVNIFNHKNYTMMVLLIALCLYSFGEVKRAKKEIKQLETEQTRLIKKESELIADVIRRSKEMGVKNEELKRYIKVLEEQRQTDACLSSPVNDNVRRLLHEAGI